MEEINTMETFEDTTPQGEPSAEPTTPEAAEGAPQPETEPAESKSSMKGTNAASESFLPIDYNHERIELSREDAVKFAQLGMKYHNSGFDIDKSKPVLNKLEYIAAQKDVSVQELVEELYNKDEAEYRAQLEERFGTYDTETIETLLKVRRDQQKEKYEQVIADRKKADEKAAAETKQKLESRLADEFSELKAEFPDVTDFVSLPDEVKLEAEKGRDLLSAYLRYKHREDVKIQAANNSAAQASKASTGSAGTAENVDDGNFNALLKGLWNN